MSWLLGSSYRNQQPPQFPPTSDGAGGGAGAGLPGGGSSGGEPPSKATKAQMDAYRFDSSALERAAAAAKELERSGMILWSELNELYVVSLIFGIAGARYSYVRLRKV